MIRVVPILIVVVSVLTGVPSTRRSDSSTETTGRQLLRILFQKKAEQVLQSQCQASSLNKKASKPSEKLATVDDKEDSDDESELGLSDVESPTSSELFYSPISDDTPGSSDDSDTDDDSDDDLETEDGRRMYTTKKVGRMRDHFDEHYGSEEAKPITLEKFKIMVESFPEVEKEFEAVFNQIDKDGNGEITREEWLEWLNKRLRVVIMQMVSQHFDETGLVGMEVMIVVVERFIADLDDEELKENETGIKEDMLKLLADADVDGDKKVSKKEFEEGVLPELIADIGDTLEQEADKGEKAPSKTGVKKC
eukprot:TRINITY_DN9610_c0_g1_i1.p1 TRINITY_DN9610_c0_g1~~TRINITY_DN9610_c0_g1_i1.p1  ORF type:complete len:308 (-),score=88.61 TRINITY_DN9610_c0_g1_i1:262-1185(-)